MIGGLWAALNHPTLFLLFMFLFILLMIWLLPRLWRGIKAVFRKLRSFFGGKDAAAEATALQRADATPAAPQQDAGGGEQRSDQR